MGIKDLKAKTAGVAKRDVERKPDDEIRTAPVRMYDVTQRMHDAERRAAELEARLKEAENGGTSLELDLAKISEVGGRKRKLSEADFGELLENLRHNRLVTPISVRRIADDAYEIVSGHNRVEAFRRLGRQTIPAFVLDVEDQYADIDAFYANLLQTSLPDYEKYLGFCLIKGRNADMTHEEIADRAGVSRQQVTRLMAFASLPPDALEALNQNPYALGANAASELAALVKAGKQEEVTVAVQKLVAGELDQAAAVAQAGQVVSAVAKSAKVKIEPKVIKTGRATYCSLRRIDKTIRLDFKSTDEAEALEQAIFELIEAHSKKEKDGS